MLTVLSINHSGKIPVYKQLLRELENQIRGGNLKLGEPVPSINELALQLDISKETVKKVYNILRDSGLLDSHQGKGFFVSDAYLQNSPTRVLVLFNSMTTYRQELLKSFTSEIGDSAQITILLHNHSVDLLEHYLDDNLGRFDYYVVAPHFAMDEVTQRAAARQISRIPNRQLIIADYLPKYLSGNFGAVYQDFTTDPAEGLRQALDRLRDFDTLNVVTVQNSLYSPFICKSIKSFCKANAVKVAFSKGVTEDCVRKGSAMLLLNSQPEEALIDVYRMCQKKHIAIGRDFGLISYNESPIAEIELGGLTTVSSDFTQMGHLIAGMILRKKMSKVKADFKLTRRNTF